ncbi:retrovirus-related pol polyprotein from transposon TNT 1-94 [Tanacetum coccineum]
MINDPLYIASSDHPRMVLTNTPFNGINFHGWIRNVRMALGAKLKLEFIDGFCPKPGVEDADLQRWIRSQILAMDPLPIVNKAYYIVQQIEKHKQVTNHSFEPTAFFANLNNKATNSGRKENRGFRNDGKNNAKKQTMIAANVSARFDDHSSVDTPFDMSYENDIWTNSCGGVDQRMVAAICKEMMKMFKGKGGDTSILGDYASTSHAGALDQITPNFDLFISVSHLKNPIIMHLHDGNSKTATIVGKVQLTPSLILTNVFYVPDFQLNLMSVGQLIQNNQLVAYFYPNDCCFQDPSTKQIVVVGKGSRCLYICKPTIDPIAFSACISEFQASHLNFTPNTCLSKESFSNFVSRNVLDVNTFHARLGHSSVSMLSHISLYKSMEFSNLSCECSHSVLHQKSITHTPQQHGRVERKYRHLLDATRAIRLHGNLTLKFWGECILTATYLINKMPVKLLDWKSPFERLYGKPPLIVGI